MCRGDVESEVRQKRKVLVSMQRAEIEVKAEKGIGLEVGVKTVSPDYANQANYSKRTHSEITGSTSWFQLPGKDTRDLSIQFVDQEVEVPLAVK